MTKDQIKSMFNNIRKQVNGLLAISVVDVTSGKTEGSLAIDDSFALEAAGKYNAEVLKAKLKAKNAMGMDKEIIELITIELTSQLHFIQPSPTEKYLIYMAVDRKTANLGMARRVIKEASSELELVA